MSPAISLRSPAISLRSVIDTGLPPSGVLEHSGARSERWECGRVRLYHPRRRRDESHSKLQLFGPLLCVKETLELKAIRAVDYSYCRIGCGYGFKNIMTTHAPLGTRAFADVIEDISTDSKVRYYIMLRSNGITVGRLKQPKVG